MANKVFFASRAQHSDEQVNKWAAAFERHLGDDGAQALKDGCVYAVGSAGRGELGKSSDLDVFVVTNERRSRLDEILVQAALIKTMSECGLEPPSNEALFLRLHSADELEQRLGGIEDDSPQNTFTARMLLLLESRAFYGHQAYADLIGRVINAYWRNYDSHPDDYLPMLLVNDIVRYWRVVLLNYEAKYARKEREAKSLGKALGDLARQKRLASYKLRFARCMTCYSMITVLLWKSRTTAKNKANIRPQEMLALVKLSPVQRVQQILTGATAEGGATSVTLATRLLDLYEGYLQSRSKPDDELSASLDDRTAEGSLFSKADAFGETMSALVQELGQNSPLIRYVIV